MANPVEKVWQIFTPDVAIDLGTATTLVAIKGGGVVINEPSVVALNTKTQQILAVGEEARHMIGRTPANVSAVRPLRDGVISDFDATEAIIRYFIQKVFLMYDRFFKINKPRIIIGVPSLITEVEARAVLDAAKSAGARKVYVIEEPIAAAIGVDLPIEEAVGSMIVDIGGGTTDIAVLSLGGMVVDNTIKIAGDEMDEAVLEYIKNKYQLLLGNKMAEDLKLKIGSADMLKEELSTEISGRDLGTGLPKTIKISSIEVREALAPVIEKIADAAKEAIEKTPPEILTDLLSRGVVLVGGGALIPGIDRYLSKKLKAPVHVAPNPMQAVVNGTYKLLDDIALLEKVQIKASQFI
jgi:rod shape-determining protein MreB